MKLLAIGILGLAVAAGTLGFARSAQAVEEPAYTIERAEGPIELRRYPGLTLAQITVEGSRGQATRRAFSPLARYIFARDRGGEKIAMTAPVMQEKAQRGWTVSFIMPAGRSLSDLPAPAGAVRLAEEPPRRVAAIRFSGRWTDARFDAATRQLRGWIAAQGLTETGAPEFGYYNDPFTPAFLRRNEVLIEVAP